MLREREEPYWVRKTMKKHEEVFRNMTPQQFLDYVQRNEGNEENLTCAWRYFASEASGSFAQGVVNLMEERGISPHVLPLEQTV